MKKHTNNTALFSEADDTRQIVNDFRLRSAAAFESYRTCEYPHHPYLEEEIWKPDIDMMWQKTLGGVDAGNGDTLDAFIEDKVFSKSPPYRSIRENHRDAIFSFGIRHDVDQKDFKWMLEDCTRELEELLAVRETLKEKLKNSGEEVF